MGGPSTRMIIFGGQWHLKIDNPWLALLKDTFMGDLSFRHVFWMCLNMLCTTKRYITAFINWFLILKCYFLLSFLNVLQCMYARKCCETRSITFFCIMKCRRQTHTVYIYCVHVLKGVCCSCMITLAVRIQIWLYDIRLFWVTLTCEQAEIISWEIL